MFDHRKAVCVDLGAIYKVNRVQVMPAGAKKGRQVCGFPAQLCYIGLFGRGQMAKGLPCGELSGAYYGDAGV